MPAEEPDGGNLHVRIWRGPRLGNRPRLLYNWISWDTTPRQLCDLELLAKGGFLHLTGFVVREDYKAVCAEMRLKDCTIWPIPIVLDVTEEIAEKLSLVV